MDPEHARELLARERARIELALAALQPGGDDELSHTDQHIADAGSELFEKERDAGLAQALGEELEAVGRAEERLAAGTYGVSIESGEPIPEERLEVAPTAERTIEEQSRFERGS